MKCEVREICGDWALDINNFNGGKITIYFNSRQNALNVKRILEVDDSIPNAATVCDMQEVVRCKDCKYYTMNTELLGNVCNRLFTVFPMKSDDFCSYGERKDNE